MAGKAKLFYHSNTVASQGFYGEIKPSIDICLPDSKSLSKLSYEVGMHCSVGRSKEQNIEIFGKIRKLGEYAASIPEKVNTMALILILLAMDIHDIDMSVDMLNAHLFHQSNLVNVVGNLTEIKVVRYSVQVWVVKPYVFPGYQLRHLLQMLS